MFNDFISCFSPKTPSPFCNATNADVVYPMASVIRPFDSFFPEGGDLPKREPILFGMLGENSQGHGGHLHFEHMVSNFQPPNTKENQNILVSPSPKTQCLLQSLPTQICIPLLQCSQCKFCQFDGIRHFFLRQLSRWR